MVLKKAQVFDKHDPFHDISVISELALLILPPNLVALFPKAALDRTNPFPDLLHLFQREMEGHALSWPKEADATERVPPMVSNQLRLGAAGTGHPLNLYRVIYPA
ncbi:MAG: hypothetical protein JW836_14805 [Deltaproteobacteria bacterium]|nr:hypothetical protein [Deltaproteobacteria bacterium]